MHHTPYLSFSPRSKVQNRQITTFPHSLQGRKKVTLSLEGQIEPLRFRHSSSSEPRPLSPQFNHPLRSLLLFPLDLFLLLSLGVVGGGRGGGEEGGGERRGKGCVTICAGGFGSTERIYTHLTIPLSISFASSHRIGVPRGREREEEETGLTKAHKRNS